MLLVKYAEGCIGAEIYSDIPTGTESGKATQRKIGRLARKYRLNYANYSNGSVYVWFESRRAIRRFRELMKEAGGKKFQRCLKNNWWR